MSSDFRIGRFFLFWSTAPHLLYDNLLDVLIEAGRRLQRLLLPLYRRQSLLHPRGWLGSRQVRAPIAVCGHWNQHVLVGYIRGLLLLLVLQRLLELFHGKLGRRLELLLLLEVAVWRFDSISAAVPEVPRSRLNEAVTVYAAPVRNAELLIYFIFPRIRNDGLI